MAVLKNLSSFTNNTDNKVLSFNRELSNLVKMSGEAYVSSSTAGMVANFESLSPMDAQNIVHTLESKSSELRSMAISHGLESLTDAQITAGAIISCAATNPRAYHAVAMSPSISVSGEGHVTVEADDGGAAGSYGYTNYAHPSLNPNMEAFDNSNLNDFTGHSITYNIQAARQDPFAEAFFRTVALTPDNGGVDVTVRNVLVFNHFQHGVTGAPADFKKRRLIDAAMDYTILSDESTSLKPEVLEDDSNANFFVPADAVPPRVVTVGHRSVRTAPLLIGKRLNLIGICQNSLSKKNGVADNTDSLDRMTGIDNIYVRLGDGDVISFNVKGLPQTYFIKSTEMGNRDTILTYRTQTLQINKNTTQWNGQPIQNTALKAAIEAGMVIQIGFDMTGTLNVEIGNMIVNATPIEVFSVHNAAGERLDLEKDIAAKALVQELAALKVIGYDPNARMSNANRREQGMQLDLNAYTERYPVPLGAPMTIPSPIAEDRDEGELNALITAVRMRNSLNAVTRLLNYFDTLSEFVGVDTNSEDTRTPQIEGIAKMLIKRPWCDHTVLHLPDVVQSLVSSDRSANIEAAITNLLRTKVYQAYRDTNIQAALDVLSGFTGEKMKVLLGTDSVLSRFIISYGDTRTLGPDLEVVKVITQDKRIFGDIYYTFIREGEGIDPLNFGSHLWIPEMISTLSPINRHGATIREALVQPRQRHVVHLPILGRIRVTGLEEVLADRQALGVDVGNSTMVLDDTMTTGGTLGG